MDGDMDDGNPCGDANPCGDGGGDTAAADDMGGDAAADSSMIVAKGKIMVAAGLNVNLSKDSVGDPLSITPDVTYGAIPKLDVGLYHSNYGLTGFWTQAGGGLCISGDACADVYNGPTGILANYGIQEGQMSMTAGGGLVLSNIAGDTMLMDIKAGVKIHYAVDPNIGIVTEPSIILSINERDPLKRDGLLLPVAIGYKVDPKLSVGVQTGITGPFDGFGDSYAIPFNLGANFAVDEKLSVGGAFGFPNLAGKDGSADGRLLTFIGTYFI